MQNISLNCKLDNAVFDNFIIPLFPNNKQSYCTYTHYILLKPELLTDLCLPLYAVVELCDEEDQTMLQT